MPWPLPVQPRTRDELALARALLGRPLRVDADGHVAAGLCTSWRADGNDWRLRCSDARKVARAIPYGRASVRGDEVRVALPFLWLRFPYALTGVTVPETVGPFRVARARPGEIVARRGRLTIVFQKVEPHRAAVLFRRGELDEAPIPLGEIRAALLDPQVRAAVRVTQLLAVDTVVFDPAHGALAALANTRRAFWHTAGRGDYQALVPERHAAAAVSLVPRYTPERVRASEFRAWRARVPSLAPVRVAIGADSEVSYGRDLLVAVWRDVGLAARTGGDDARLVRVRAPYAQDEALLAALLLPRDDLPGRAALVRALGETEQSTDLVRADGALFDAAAAIPIAWTVDARFVSARAQGWREDRLGVPDYGAVGVRSPASSRHP